MFSDEACLFSCDINKLKVGPPSVSHYHQISRFFPVEDKPNVPDHDFEYGDHDNTQSKGLESMETSLTKQGTSPYSPESSEAEMVNLSIEEGTAPDSTHSSPHHSSNKAEMVDLTMDNTPLNQRPLQNPQ